MTILVLIVLPSATRNIFEMNLKSMLSSSAAVLLAVIGAGSARRLPEYSLRRRGNRKDAGALARRNGGNPRLLMDEAEARARSMAYLNCGGKAGGKAGKGGKGGKDGGMDGGRALYACLEYGDPFDDPAYFESYAIYNDHEQGLTSSDDGGPIPAMSFSPVAPGAPAPVHSPPVAPASASVSSDDAEPTSALSPVPMPSPFMAPVTASVPSAPGASGSASVSFDDAEPTSGPSPVPVPVAPESSRPVAPASASVSFDDAEPDTYGPSPVPVPSPNVAPAVAPVSFTPFAPASVSINDAEPTSGPSPFPAQAPLPAPEPLPTSAPEPPVPAPAGPAPTAGVSGLRGDSGSNQSMDVNTDYDRYVPSGSNDGDDTEDTGIVRTGTSESAGMFISIPGSDGTVDTPDNVPSND